MANALQSPFSFALVLLSIEWARCLGEMKTVKRASSWNICIPDASATIVSIFYL
jgi:hypothetical protein